MDKAIATLFALILVTGACYYFLYVKDVLEPQTKTDNTTLISKPAESEATEAVEPVEPTLTEESSEDMTPEVSEPETPMAETSEDIEVMTWEVNDNITEEPEATPESEVQEEAGNYI